MKRILRNSVFRFLLSYMLVLVIPLLIVSYGFQKAFQIVENNLKVTCVNMLQHSADVIENEFVGMESMALQMANSTSILEAASQKKGDDNYIEMMMSALLDFTLQLNYQDIELMESDGAYIYFRNTDLVMFEKSYYKPEIFKTYLNNWGIDYEKWRGDMTDEAFVVPVFRKSGNGFEYAFPFSKGMFGERQGVIVFRVDEEAVARKMEFINNLENLETYLVEILDASGEQLWVSNTLEQFPELAPEELQSGYAEKDGLSIISVRSDNLGWYYVLALPVKESLSELLMLKNTILFLMVAAVLGSMVLSMVQAVRKGKPVDLALQALTPEGEAPEQYANLGTAVSDIMRRHADVLREVEKNKFSLQKSFFDDLLKAEFSTEAQLKTSALKVGLDIDNQIYQTAYIQIFAENDFSTVDEQTLSEIRVISQLMKNYMRKLCNQNVWFHKKNYNSEIAIFAIDHMEEDVVEIIGRTREWMIREGQIEITSGIGGTCNNLLLIWRSMEEARVALENCTREDPIVNYHSELIDSNTCYFPSIAEDKLEECLRSGQWQETKDILSLLETENCVNRHLHRAQLIKLNRKLMDVLGGVWKAEKLQEQAFWINEVLLQPEISQTEYFHRLRQMCRKVCNDNVEKKQEQRGRLVQEIKEYIRAHYCESDMGLSKVGSEFRMSESYLSTVFKEQSGGNFADYIETLRIEKACGLLQDKELTINDVAEMVGYNSVQSFRRAFKRVKGVSPKELRS